MDIERKVLVSYMLGFIDAKKQGTNYSDRLILLDQTLIDMNQAPLSHEEKINFLEELVTEIETTFMLAGFNRKNIRDLRSLKQKK